MTSSSKDSEFFYFRSEFDKTLKMYFREIIDLSVLPPNLNLNIPVLSCLILLVEREIEIRDFPNSPPERYTRDSFLDDIENVGIGVDRIIFDTVSELFSLGFIIEINNEIKPSETAFKLVNFINSIFPGMPGINFIAYLVQTIGEVYTDRKSLAEGKETFYQTLKTRGLKKNSVSESALKSFQTQAPVEKKGISSKTLKEKLNQLRKSRTSSGNELYKNVQVKSIFGTFDNQEQLIDEESSQKELSQEELSQEELSQEELSQEELSQEELSQEELSQEELSQEELSQEELSQEELSQEEPSQEEPSQEELSQEEPSQEEPSQEEPSQEEPSQEELSQEELSQEELSQEEPSQEELSQEELSQEELSQEEPGQEEPGQEEPSQEEPGQEEASQEEAKVLSEEEIAKKISMFENELAMVCPVCNEGKIIESETEKGKIFYQCTNNMCHFISWAKPFHFACPSCNNPFLVEEIFADGSKGLKCPRATCDYIQKDQKNPALSVQPKKKKRVVRRVRKKK